MFCPKCGAQNADGTKFCRGCGADVGSVLAVVEGKPPARAPLAEKQIELWSAGWRGLIGGVGFVLVGALALGISERLAVLTIFLLTFGMVFLATGISRFIQARALKKLLEPGTKQDTPSLSTRQADYIQPMRSLFETDDLAATSRSVTEHTTTRLELDQK